MNKKILFLTIFGLVMLGIGVSAGIVINANQVSYNNKTVEDALNDLYDKAKNANPFITHKGVVYLDPANLSTVCDESNSTIGRGTSGCMKWYIYDNSGDNYTMILDHDISSSKFNAIETELARYVQNWNGNPRIISLEEVINIAKINMSKNLYWYSFGTKVDTYFSKQTFEQQMIQRTFSWLFDYTQGCESYGCNKSLSSDGYWTSTPYGDNGNQVWSVYHFGGIYPVYTSNSYGIRPVITIPKSSINTIH